MRDPDARAASPTSEAPYRLLRVALIATLIIAAGVTAIATAGRLPFFQENGPAETAQLELWIGAALFAFVLALPQKRRSDTAAMALVGLAAAAAAAREIDAHILLNPETIGSLGVRYRIDWWLDGSVSILRKGAWAAAVVVAAAVVIGATLAARFRPLHAIATRSPTFILFAACAGCLAIGFTFDDLLRNRIPLATAQACEESVEVLAPLFYLAAINSLAVAALTGRRSARNGTPADTLVECKPTPNQPNQTSSPSAHSTSTASANASPGSTTSTRPGSATASAHS